VPTIPTVVAELIEHLSKLGVYPPLVKPVAAERRIHGTAFFPGGLGLWSPGGVAAPLSQRPIVIVGHNWGTPRDHDWAYGERSEYEERWPESKRRKCATWWNLLPILRGAGIGPEQCYFTNAYMGLKGNGDSNVGPLCSDEDFDWRCREFLSVQLRILQPSMVVTLGSEARDMLAGLFIEPPTWRGPRGGHRGVVQLRNAGVDLASRRDEKRPFVHAVIAHPCDPRNLSAGFTDEISLLKRALTMVPIDI